MTPKKTIKKKPVTVKAGEEETTTNTPVDEVVDEKKLIDPGEGEDGTVYTLYNYEAGQQVIVFKTLETDGTTNEAVLEMLIHRLGVLDNKVPSGHTLQARNHLVIALDVLRRRTADREARGVDGTMNV